MKKNISNSIRFIHNSYEADGYKHASLSKILVSRRP